MKGIEPMANEHPIEDVAPIQAEAPLEGEIIDEEGVVAVAEADDLDEDEEDLDEPPFQIGESVVVKPDELDPDTEQPIGGWQGRVMGYHEEDPLLVDIAWDSQTLRGMSMEWMARAELEGLDWGRMYLEFDTLDPATPRDSEQDVEETREELQARVVDEVNLTGNLHMLEHGKAVLALLNGQPTRDEHTVFVAWHTYLQQALKLPFVAEVATRDHPPLHQGDRVTVRAITSLDDQEGTMVRVQHRHDTFEVPLIALRIGTPSAANYQLLADYTEWLEERKDLEAPILLPPSAFLHL
jgi:hypothetical protein